MRQTLLRLRLDDLFTTEPLNGQTALGVGWLLVPWLVYFAAWLYVNRSRLAATRDTAAAVAAQFLVPAAILGVGMFAGRAGVAPTGVPLRGYGLMLGLGFVAGCWTAGRRVRRLGIAPEAMWDLGLWLL